ncbi:hypothetical protein EDB80DRAFT_688268 [Ilyonectria destructans]|nr:hypothetical protein EDB80DRAFT_688268 [Ilyonectria destructans]
MPELRWNTLARQRSGRAAYVRLSYVWTGHCQNQSHSSFCALCLVPCALCLATDNAQPPMARHPSPVTRRQGCVWPVTPWPVAVVRQNPTKCATKTQRAVWERRRGSGRRAKRRAVATCYWWAPGTQTPRASEREMAGAWGEVQRRRGRARGRLDSPSQAPHRPPLRILSACFLYVGRSSREASMLVISYFVMRKLINYKERHRVRETDKATNRMSLFSQLFRPRPPFKNIARLLRSTSSSEMMPGPSTKRTTTRTRRRTQVESSYSRIPIKLPKLQCTASNRQKAIAYPGCQTGGIHVHHRLTPMGCWMFTSHPHPGQAIASRGPLDAARSDQPARASNNHGRGGSGRRPAVPLALFRLQPPR